MDEYQKILTIEPKIKKAKVEKEKKSLNNVFFIIKDV